MSIARTPGGDVSFRTFMFPGVIAMTVLFSAGSIVFDREFGFLREMLVAPIRRGSIVTGAHVIERRFEPALRLLGRRCRFVPATRP